MSDLTGLPWEDNYIRKEPRKKDSNPKNERPVFTLIALGTIPACLVLGALLFQIDIFVTIYVSFLSEIMLIPMLFTVGFAIIGELLKERLFLVRLLIYLFCGVPIIPFVGYLLAA